MCTASLFGTIIAQVNEYFQRNVAMQRTLVIWGWDWNEDKKGWRGARGRMTYLTRNVRETGSETKPCCLSTAIRVYRPSQPEIGRQL